MKEDIVSLIIGVFVGIALMLILIIHTTQSNSSVIEHNCAEYNKITGKFQWIEVIE